MKKAGIKKLIGEDIRWFDTHIHKVKQGKLIEVRGKYVYVDFSDYYMWIYTPEMKNIRKRRRL